MAKKHPQLSKGIQKYMEFYDLEPNRIGEFPSNFEIPSEVILLGPSVNVAYRSDKWGEGSYDYIHEHHQGVKTWVPADLREGYDRKVPKFIYETKTLVRLGDCLLYTYQDDEGKDEEVNYEDIKTKPSLYTTPCGKALLVIKRKPVKVEVIIWGGKLGVEARGIVH